MFFTSSKTTRRKVSRSEFMLSSTLSRHHRKGLYFNFWLLYLDTRGKKATYLCLQIPIHWTAESREEKLSLEKLGRGFWSKNHSVDSLRSKWPDSVSSPPAARSMLLWEGSCFVKTFLATVDQLLIFWMKWQQHISQGLCVHNTLCFCNFFFTLKGIVKM